MTDLSDFGGGTDVGPPQVERKRVRWSPTSPNKPAGFVGWWMNRSSKVYTSRRKPYHFYRDGDGYAVSVQILRALNRIGVPSILLYEADGGDVFEFTRRQYASGGPVPEDDLLDEDDPQVYVPLSDARSTWEGVGEGMFKRPFEEAMDYCLRRTP